MKLPSLGIAFSGILIAVQVSVPTSASPGQDGFLEAGNRLLVQTAGREDYSPRIVECSAPETGICLRDTRGTPADNPFETAGDGKLRVTLDSWGITYIISPNGTGRTLNADGKELKPFTWRLIPE